MDAALAIDFELIIRNFQIEGEFLDAVPYGSGHINDTYLVRTKRPNKRASAFILQRINNQVFKKPAEVMHNMERVTGHIREAVAAAGGDPPRKKITLIPARGGSSYFVSDSGDYWRVLRFIEGARTYQRATNPAHYYHAARAFGEFLKLLSNYPASHLFNIMPGFHHTPRRYRAFLDALDRDPVQRARKVKPEIEFIIDRERETGILVDLTERGIMPERVTHNDTKIDNVMIDDETGEGVCVIDLDTVMPGWVVFDFGDSVRSGANTGAEDEPDIAKVSFDLNVFDRLVNGFLDATRDILIPIEVEKLAFGAKLITLEQGIRFLTDYLNGDTYYKIQHPDQNLDRSRTQLKMVADMEAKSDQMEAIVEKYR
jgi:aminoglycoside phosphotransferase (APT) family kinase protein